MFSFLSNITNTINKIITPALKYFNLYGGNQTYTNHNPNFLVPVSTKRQLRLSTSSSNRIDLVNSFISRLRSEGFSVSTNVQNLGEIASQDLNVTSFQIGGNQAMFLQITNPNSKPNYSSNIYKVTPTTQTTFAGHMTSKIASPLKNGTREIVAVGSLKGSTDIILIHIPKEITSAYSSNTNSIAPIQAQHGYTSNISGNLNTFIPHNAVGLHFDSQYHNDSSVDSTSQQRHNDKNTAQFPQVSYAHTATFINPDIRNTEQGFSVNIPSGQNYTKIETLSSYIQGNTTNSNQFGSINGNIHIPITENHGVFTSHKGIDEFSYRSMDNDRQRETIIIPTHISPTTTGNLLRSESQPTDNLLIDQNNHVSLNLYSTSLQKPESHRSDTTDLNKELHNLERNDTISNKSSVNKDAQLAARQSTGDNMYIESYKEIISQSDSTSNQGQGMSKSDQSAKLSDKKKSAGSLSEQNYKNQNPSKSETQSDKKNSSKKSISGASSVSSKSIPNHKSTTKPELFNLYSKHNSIFPGARQVSSTYSQDPDHQVMAKLQEMSTKLEQQQEKQAELLKEMSEKLTSQKDFEKYMQELTEKFKEPKSEETKNMLAAILNKVQNSQQDETHTSKKAIDQSYDEELKNKATEIKTLKDQLSSLKNKKTELASKISSSDLSSSTVSSSGGEDPKQVLEAISKLSEKIDELSKKTNLIQNQADEIKTQQSLMNNKQDKDRNQAEINDKNINTKLDQNKKAAEESQKASNQAVDQTSKTANDLKIIQNQGKEIKDDQSSMKKLIESIEKIKDVKQPPVIVKPEEKKEVPQTNGSTGKIIGGALAGIGAGAGGVIGKQKYDNSKSTSSDNDYDEDDIQPSNIDPIEID